MACFAYLKDLPISSVKIDGRFMKNFPVQTIVDGSLPGTNHAGNFSLTSTTEPDFMLLPRKPEKFFQCQGPRGRINPVGIYFRCSLSPKERRQNHDDRSLSSWHDHLKSGRRPATIRVSAETRTTLKNRP
jgi:hypothetical protein